MVETTGLLHTNNRTYLFAYMDQIIYLITLGAFMATAIGLFFWVHYHLFLNERSRWKRQQLRLLTGILALIIFALFSYFAFYYEFRDRGPHNVFTLEGLFSSVIIAQCGLAVFSLSDRRLLSAKTIALHYVMPLTLLGSFGAVCYFLNDNVVICTIIRAVSWVYYSSYAIVMYYISLKNSRKFSQRLEDNYVE